VNCWHLGYADRFKNNPIFSKEVREAYSGGNPVLLMDELESPLHKRKSCVIGVQFMGDLFHPDVPFYMIDEAYAIMRVSMLLNKYVVLTKRPDIAQEYFESIPPVNSSLNVRANPDNIIFGVSVENQKAADERIPLLLQIPAKKRIISVEPLLGNIDLRYIKVFMDKCEPLIIDTTRGLNKINNIIIGCESGPKRRPCNLEWVRSLVNQAKSADVKVFIKQLDINGKVEHDINKFPKDLRIQEKL
jgi:protein gp37